MEASDTQLPFLDIMINKEGKTIFMDIYSKPTDSKRYFSFKSNHPEHCLKNMPFSLARRICMIAKKDSLGGIKFLRTRNTSTRAALPKKNYKSRYKQSFQNTPKRIKKCKRTRKKKILSFISMFNPSNPKNFAFY